MIERHALVFFCKKLYILNHLHRWNSGCFLLSNPFVDNWRYGTMQFWVPAVLRDDYDPSHLYDTSNHNHTFENHMGIDPAGDDLRHPPQGRKPACRLHRL